jgi:circadian clock protein KaiC
VDLDSTKRINTGIRELDEMTGGGLIKNTVTILAGPAGCGKTSFCLSFLYAGAKGGENGLYVSLEEEISGLKAAAKSIGLEDFEEMLDANKIVIFDIGKMKIETDFEEFMSVDNILKHIGVLTKGSGIRFERIVIDSLSALSPTYGSEGEIRKAFFRLFRVLREDNFTTFATTEVDEKEKTTRFGEAYLADTVVRLGWHPRVTETAVYTIQIPKMRYSYKSNKEYQYSITDYGIKISSEAMAW